MWNGALRELKKKLYAIGISLDFILSTISSLTRAGYLPQLSISIILKPILYQYYDDI